MITRTRLHVKVYYIACLGLVFSMLEAHTIVFFYSVNIKFRTVIFFTLLDYYKATPILIEVLDEPY